MSRKCVAGIDEAGLGPRIGPLVVTLVAFTGMKPSQPVTFEGFLSKSFSKIPPDDDSRIRVDDSKVIYRGPAGLARIEKAALSIWVSLFGSLPATLGEWLNRFTDFDMAHFRECPWYGPDPSAMLLPLAASPESVHRSGRRLRATLQEGNLDELFVRQRILTAPMLNRGIARLGNKARVLARGVFGLIREISPKIAEGDLEIDVDKLGGRAYYGELIRGAFPLTKLAVEQEGPAISTYGFRHENRRTRIRFLRRGDGQCLHISLASMLSKYTRELFMHLFNRFWQGQAPSLKPTAGYPVDALRFLEDVAPTARAAGIDPGSFTRIR